MGTYAFFLNFYLLTLDFSASFMLRVLWFIPFERLYSIPRLDIIIPHFIYSTVGRQLVFSLGPLWMELLFFWCSHARISIGYTPRDGNLGHQMCISLIDKAKCSSSNEYSLQQGGSVPIVLHWSFARFFPLAHLNCLFFLYKYKYPIFNYQNAFLICLKFVFPNVNIIFKLLNWSKSFLS